MKKTSLLITTFILAVTAIISPLTLAFEANINETQQQNWRTELAKSLPVLGHRNFIVIADSAYPLQSNPGIKTIYTGEQQIVVVKAVLAAVENAAHVNGTIYVDKELSYVPEKNAKGIEAYRKALDKVLIGRDIQRLPHMDIIKKLDASGELFNVVILKTDLTLPYTSVFIELGAGYWNEASETELRESMK
ncbi:RbsD/FucU domain-containing protein [Colwellia piezophila]|uniref:RbsD/FucU domain-containing protein n=1 Tax=Colwellia piezophila TaxID=211668 RepID=UPI0003A8AC83|nr:RbsD/FucU domain-containing protein [Colwellia piezophila]